MSHTNRFTRGLSLSVDLIQSGDGKEVVDRVRHRIWSSTKSYGLARNVTVPFRAPAAQIPISIRAIRPEDASQLFDVNAPGLSTADRGHQLARLRWLEAGFSSCFVAATDDNKPCYIQWLISPQESALLNQEFGNSYPNLAPDEMVLEGAFTPEAFRGLRIMPAAMALLAERAAELGASRVITTVEVLNIPSLKGCERAGFTPYTIKEAVYRFGLRQTHFHPLE